jgi:hypothetical protein
MNAVAIELSGRDVVQIAMPDVLVTLRQLDTFQFATALAVEQAKLDPVRVGRKQRKIGAPTVPACAKA